MSPDSVTDLRDATEQVHNWQLIKTKNVVIVYYPNTWKQLCVTQKKGLKTAYIDLVADDNWPYINKPNLPPPLWRSRRNQQLTHDWCQHVTLSFEHRMGVINVMW